MQLILTLALALESSDKFVFSHHQVGQYLGRLVEFSMHDVIITFNIEWY